MNVYDPILVVVSYGLTPTKIALRALVLGVDENGVLCRYVENKDETILPFEGEGITWARGWDDETEHALLAANELAGSPWTAMRMPG